MHIEQAALPVAFDSDSESVNQRPKSPIPVPPGHLNRELESAAIPDLAENRGGNPPADSAKIRVGTHWQGIPDSRLRVPVAAGRGFGPLPVPA